MPLGGGSLEQPCILMICFDIIRHSIEELREQELKREKANAKLAEVHAQRQE